MKNIALIGYRGTGKTTVAQHLAQQLGWNWVDADVELERQAGQTIAEIFASQGERAFRDLETNILQQLVQQQNHVLALGGGVILRPENRQQLQTVGVKVWLTATPETIWERVSQDSATSQRRPNLTTSGGISEIRELLEVRTPWYQECANLQVSTEDKSPESIAAEIIQSDLIHF